MKDEQTKLGLISVSNKEKYLAHAKTRTAYNKLAEGDCVACY